MEKFASHGHRVYWLNPNRCQTAEAATTATLVPIQNNSSEVCWAGSLGLDHDGTAIDTESVRRVVAAVRSLAEAENLVQAVVVVGQRVWVPVALELRKLLGWKWVCDYATGFCAATEVDSSAASTDLLMGCQSDLMVVDTQELFEKWRQTRPCLLLGGRGLEPAAAGAKPELSAQMSQPPGPDPGLAWFQQMDAAIVRLYAKASIIIVCYNNLAFTRQCVDSILRNTEYPDYEIVVVDNASTDGTVEYLQQFASRQCNVRIILNDRNLGFATANNQGIRLASGVYIILLNNDTVVPGGWLTRLIGHLEDPKVGMVGPVSNFVGNEARIRVDYRDLNQMEAFAQLYSWSHLGKVFDIPTLAMQCVAMRKSVIQEVGLLDEQFGVGMFEDDDYAYRVHRQGYRVVCAEDVFVHHYGESSFKKLPPGEYEAIFERNRLYYEKKWGVKWQSHRSRVL